MVDADIPHDDFALWLWDGLMLIIVDRLVSLWIGQHLLPYDTLWFHCLSYTMESALINHTGIPDKFNGRIII